MTFAARSAYLGALRTRSLTVESRLAGTFILPVRTTATLGDRAAVIGYSLPNRPSSASSEVQAKKPEPPRTRRSVRAV